MALTLSVEVHTLKFTFHVFLDQDHFVLSGTREMSLLAERGLCVSELVIERWPGKRSTLEEIQACGRQQSIGREASVAPHSCLEARGTVVKRLIPGASSPHNVATSAATPLLDIPIPLWLLVPV